MKTTTSFTRNLIGCTPRWRAFFAISVAFACFELSPQTRAVCQEGCLTNENTVLGDDALLNNTDSDNTALGFETLFSDTSGGFNTAVGARAMISNSTGDFNTAVGYIALASNTTGSNNTAVGEASLVSSTTASGNTAVGSFALSDDTTGSGNTGTGDVALSATTTGNNNTANGFQALAGNTTGSNNTAIGLSALLFNSFGSGNTALGTMALNSSRQNNNTAIGFSALSNLSTGGNNIALGESAGSNLTSGGNNIDIGNRGVAGEAKAIRIGKVGTQTNTFIAGINGVTIAGGVGVIIDTNGHLGTIVSSASYKDAIKPMDKASEAILALKPVTFRYKHELDPDGIPQFGLVAEEVEKINPALVAHDDQGKPYTVRYEAVNAMLLNEFLKEHKAFVEERRTVEELKKQVAALTAGLQKVSVQLELSQAATETALNNQ